MVTGVYILSLLVFLMLVGALPSPGGGQEAVFRSPVMLALLGALAVSLVLCSLRRKLSWREVGFYMTHGGVVLILLGALLGFLWGRESRFRLPVTAGHRIRQLRPGGDERISLPFALAVSDFRIFFHDPDYALCRPVPAAAEAQATPNYEAVRSVHVGGRNALDLGEHGKIPVNRLRDAQGQWRESLPLDDGWILQQMQPLPRRFVATLLFERDPGVTRTADLRINHPVQHQGWRFYLQGYGTTPVRFVLLSARKDPGRRCVVTGMYALMAGVAVMCFRRRERRMDHAC